MSVSQLKLKRKPSAAVSIGAASGARDAALKKKRPSVSADPERFLGSSDESDADQDPVQMALLSKLKEDEEEEEVAKPKKEQSVVNKKKQSPVASASTSAASSSVAIVPSPEKKCTASKTVKTEEKEKQTGINEQAQVRARQLRVDMLKVIATTHKEANDAYTKVVRAINSESSEDAVVSLHRDLTDKRNRFALFQTFLKSGPSIVSDLIKLGKTYADFRVEDGSGKQDQKNSEYLLLGVKVVNTIVEVTDFQEGVYRFLFSETAGPTAVTGSDSMK